jgi:capsid portal protein
MKLFRNYLKKLTTPTTQTNTNIEEDVTDEEYTFDVVGESFQRDHLVQIIKNTKSADLGEIYTTATLKLEPENPFDSSAVMVIINDLHVGYIPKSQSGMMTDYIQAKGGNTLEVPARIGWDTESPQPLVGVRLKIEDF